MQKSKLILTTAIIATATVALVSMSGHADRKKSIDRGGTVGPDVVAWTIAGENSFDFNYYGSEGGIGGYAIATQSCNFGDMVADWYGGTANVPTILANMFRLKDGVFEQIGMQSFGKHSFCAVSEPGCGNCQSTGCETLGIGCADTYWAGLNANGEVPRSDVNAFTGFYNYPFTVSPTGPSSIRGNLQIANDDVDPSMNQGARYFVEGMYVTQDDADWGNQMNNASWREVGFNSVSNPVALGNGPTQTNVGDPAIVAWAEVDPDVELTIVDTPNDGRIYVAVKVTENNDGTYHYEYAVHNLNCERSIGSLTIPVGDSSITNLGFHDVNTNSGEIYDSTDWSYADNSGEVTWNTVSYEANPNGNALRWGTMYNFRFDSTTAPATGEATFGFFKPDEDGGVDGFTVSATVPAGAAIDPCELPLGNCPADVDGDNVVAVGDILAVISTWGVCGDGTFRPDGDVDGNCCVAVGDILAVISAWGADCSSVGACCLPEGGCAIITEEHCQTESGTYQGDDSTCAQSNCPDTGACCFADGKCVEMMSTKCIAAGGGFQGNNTDCSADTCPIAGEGDECTSAMIASFGANAFETNSATASADQPDDSQCSGTYLNWDNSDDIWFMFTPKQSGSVYFTTCDGASYDTSMVLYEGDCGNQVTCNGDSDDGSGCQAYHSAFDYNVSAGETYYIRIGGWQGDTGIGTLTIE